MTAPPLYLVQPGPRPCAVDATHSWGLPGTTCPRCGQTWSSTGLDYPALDLSSAPSEKRLRQGWLASWEQYQALRDEVAKLLPLDTPLSPGAKFGASVGSSKGPRFGAIWPNPWTLMFAGEAFDRLARYDLDLPAMIEASIKDRKESSAIVEAALPPLYMLDPASFEPGPPPCSMCKREGRKLSQQIWIRGDFEPAADLVRSADFTTRIFATERFREAAVAEGIEGLVFAPVSRRGDA